MVISGTIVLLWLAVSAAEPVILHCSIGDGQRVTLLLDEEDHSVTYAIDGKPDTDPNADFNSSSIMFHLGGDLALVNRMTGSISAGDRTGSCDVSKRKF